MKRFSAPLGILSVFAVISALSACSSDDSSPASTANSNQEAAAESATSSAASSSAAKSETATSSAATAGSSTVAESSSSSRVVHQRVEADSNSYDDPYFSSGIFCWTESCEANYSSEASTVASSSSAATIEGPTIEEPVVVEPTVAGNQMIDQRDQQVYALETIAGTLWMAENLNYYTANSFCSTLESSETACAEKGRFYLYAAAKKACPSGWRLPTATEVEAANAEVELTWWPIDGRIKVTDGAATEYGLDAEQGYIWIEDDGTNNSWRIENYTDKQVTELQSGSATERAYNVRCVQE